MDMVPNVAALGAALGAGLTAVGAGIGIGLMGHHAHRRSPRRGDRPLRPGDLYHRGHQV